MIVDFEIYESIEDDVNVALNRLTVLCFDRGHLWGNTGKKLAHGGNIRGVLPKDRYKGLVVI